MPIYTTRYSLPSPVGTESNNPPADIRALAVAVEARLGVVDDAGSNLAATWTPSAWSGSSAASPWDNSGGLTSGRVLVDAHHWLHATAMVDLNDNGPSPAAQAQCYVSVPTAAPVGYQSGQDMGGWVYADPTGNPQASGRLAWNASVNKLALVTSTGYALIQTSFHYRLSYSLSYRVA